VAVYRVRRERGLIGVKVALAPEQRTVPATAVPAGVATPGPGTVTVRVKLEAVMVAQFIASLKFAVST
jgi:hypothetical protein